MLDPLQKFLLILSFFVISLVAMEDKQAIIYTEKCIFVPTANTKQANADLVKEMRTVFENPSEKQSWKNIKKFLKNGADPNLIITHLQYSNPVGYDSPIYEDPLIYLAAWHGKKKLFDYLLQLRADIDAINICGLTTLQILVASNNRTALTVEYLLQHGANPNKINYKKETPLIIAIKSGYKDFVQSLIQYKADVNQKNDTCAPLGIAIQCKNIEIIKQLCEAKASPSNIDNNDNTVFHAAVSNNLLEFIETLIAHIKFEVKNSQQSQLEQVNEHVQYIKHILQIKNKENKTALDLLPKEGSIGRGYMSYIEKLLNGTMLQQELDILTEKYSNLSSILGDNLALQILENHYNSQEQKQNNV